ncbi:hypothetical protein EV426DRAFT_578959 [Tirmania nivea]|nr:hypothetical protein EV426DRAFT_578959 [Tirmania nivea]
MKFAHIFTFLLSLAAGGAFSAPVTSPDPFAVPAPLPATSGNQPLKPNCVNHIAPPKGYSVSLREASILIEQAQFASEFASQCYRDPEHHDYNICFRTSHGDLGYMGDSKQVDLKTILKGALAIRESCTGNNVNNGRRTGGTVTVQAGNGKSEKSTASTGYRRRKGSAPKFS